MGLKDTVQLQSVLHQERADTLKRGEGSLNSDRIKVEYRVDDHRVPGCGIKDHVGQGEGCGIKQGVDVHGHSPTKPAVDKS